jgi:hypothetical protein
MAIAIITRCAIPPDRKPCSIRASIGYIELAPRSDRRHIHSRNQPVVGGKKDPTIRHRKAGDPRPSRVLVHIDREVGALGCSIGLKELPPVNVVIGGEVNAVVEDKESVQLRFKVWPANGRDLSRS